MKKLRFPYGCEKDIFTPLKKALASLERAIKQPVKWEEIKEVFSNSALPYKVDISDWHRITNKFQASILKEAEDW